jgi:hypothetical protein
VPKLPLFAADIIQLIIFLFIVVSSIVAQIAKAMQERKKRLPAKPRPAVPAQPARDKKSAIEQEIEAFLKKGQGKPAAERSNAERMAAERSKEQRDLRSREQRKPPARRPKTPVRAEARANRPPRPPVPPTLEGVAPGESVTSHVQRHVVAGGVGTRDPRLAESIGQADERIESHLQNVFEHRVGRLGQTDRAERGISQGTDAAVWETQTAVNPLAAQVHAMLASPDQVGAAIVLNEILRRPEEQW